MLLSHRFNSGEVFLERSLISVQIRVFALPIPLKEQVGVIPENGFFSIWPQRIWLADPFPILCRAFLCPKSIRKGLLMIDCQ